MNNCYDCVKSKITEPWGDLKCGIKNHTVISSGEYMFRGKIFKNGQIVDCPDFKEGKRNE